MAGRIEIPDWSGLGLAPWPLIIVPKESPLMQFHQEFVVIKSRVHLLCASRSYRKIAISAAILNAINKCIFET